MNTSNQIKIEITFSGQHSDEKVISEIKPYAPVIVVKTFYKILISSVITTFFWYGNLILLEYIPDYRISGTLIISLTTLFLIWLSFLTSKQRKTFITDRRIVHFEPSSPFSSTKKSLFWSEATRAKDSEDFSLWNLLKVGTVHVLSYDGSEKSEILLRYIYNSEDLTNYIDKLIFSFKQNPDSLKDFPSFEPDPKKRVYLNPKVEI